jgi:uncharacterized protein
VLEVIFYRDRGGRLCGLRASGHADFDEHGKDIVCAAASAVLQAAHLGLVQHAGTDVAVRREPGLLELHWKDDERHRERAGAIAATAELAVEQIARRYPKHVRLKRVTELSDRRRNDDV